VDAVFCFVLVRHSGSVEVMAESLILDTQPRMKRGSRAARKLRKEGRIPAVIYGHKEATVAVTLSGDDLGKAIRHGTRVVDLKESGKLEKALIREVQWDHLGKDVLHVDFTRVSADERIRVNVPVELRGIAPGVTGGTGVIDQPIHSLSVECLAISIPESIRVTVNELQLGMAIHVRDLVMPPGVVAMNDPDAIVVHVTAKQVEPEPVAAAAAAPVEGATEPEIIGRKVAEEEEAE
jgi:large subunit ribosomal protein L25